ncbi:hypothetical protein ACFL34_04005 [Candidatus Sumerlaeota bacterium]
MQKLGVAHLSLVRFILARGFAVAVALVAALNMQSMMGPKFKPVPPPHVQGCEIALRTCLSTEHDY